MVHRTKLQGTNIRKLKSKVVTSIFITDQTNAFNKQYNKFDFDSALKRFKNDYPEYFK